MTGFYMKCNTGIKLVNFWNFIKVLFTYAQKAGLILKLKDF